MIKIYKNVNEKISFYNRKNCFIFLYINYYPRLIDFFI